jgi:transcriptional regulator with XRE-family HTH domain
VVDDIGTATDEEVWERMLLRHALGDVLRRMRQQQGRTLREVAETARVSVPYLSEVERGRKEASSEILAAVCLALGVSLRALLDLAGAELAYESLPVDSTPVESLRVESLPVESLPAESLPAESLPAESLPPSGDELRSHPRVHSPDDVLAMVGPGPWVEPELARVLTTL